MSSSETKDAIVEPPSKKPKKQLTSYSLTKKIEIAKYACQVRSINAAAKHYNVDRHSIRDWKSKLPQLEAQSKQQTAPKTNLSGGGRHLKSQELEDRILSFSENERKAHRRVSRGLVKREARRIWDHLTAGDEQSEKFSASEGWLWRFLKRNKYSNRRKTTAEQKDPEDAGKYISNFIRYVVQLRKQNDYPLSNIFAADETAVWPDDPAPTTLAKTGSKSVPVLSTGHEKMRFTVLLAASASGTKLKPLILIPRVRKRKELAKFETKLDIVYAGSGKNWMTEELTKNWIKNNLGKDLFGKRRLLAWDAFKCHKTAAVKELLKQSKIDVAMIPGGCTKYIQAPDVCWNKPFKDHWHESREEWMRSVGDNMPKTANGNPAAPSMELVCQWVINAWESISKQLIIKSFRACGLSLALDGSEDDEIACFAKGGPLDGKQVTIEADDDEDEDEDEDAHIDSDTSIVSVQL